jgi:transcriptional regulator with XRE-family HTH domain
MVKIYLSQNLRHLRRSDARKPTQSEMAAMLGVSISTYGAYEEGRAEPRLENLQRIAVFFGIDTGSLLSCDLAGGAKPELRAEKEQPKTTAAFPEVLTITVDSAGNNNIEWVPEKAAAGYTSGYADPGFISALPVFQLPFLDKNRKYRAFTIKGDSMLPLPSGAMVFGEYADQWQSVRDASLCIIITRNEGIIFKKVYNYLEKQGCLLLVSTNPAYEPYLLPAEEVLEIWKFAGYYASGFPESLS